MRFDSVSFIVALSFASIGPAYGLFLTDFSNTNSSDEKGDADSIVGVTYMIDSVGDVSVDYFTTGKLAEPTIWESNFTPFKVTDAALYDTVFTLRGTAAGGAPVIGGSDGGGLSVQTKGNAIISDSGSQSWTFTVESPDAIRITFTEWTTGTSSASKGETADMAVYRNGDTASSQVFSSIGTNGKRSFNSSFNSLGNGDSFTFISREAHNSGAALQSFAFGVSRAVPEPSSYALLAGLMALSVIVIRHR